CFAKTWAIPLPIPLLAPVMMTFLPSKSFICCSILNASLSNIVDVVVRRKKIPFTRDLSLRSKGSLTEHLLYFEPDFRWGIHYVDTTFTHDSFLGLGRIVAATYNGSGMSHGTTRGCGLPGNEANDGLFAAGLLVPSCGLGLQLPTDFPDHDHTLGLGIAYQELDRLLGGGADNGISPDSYGRGNPQSLADNLVSGLIGEGAGFGNDSHIALFEYESGHDAYFGLPRGDDPRTIRTDQGTVHILYKMIGLDHVRDRNALGNGDDHLDSRTGRFHDGICGKCR